MSAPEKIRAVIEMAAAYYLDNPTGGYLHIVLDDENSERCHVEWCRDLAAKNGDLVGVTLADALLELDDDEREKVCEDYEYGEGPEAEES